jgi:hypothetical protein
MQSGLCRPSQVCTAAMAADFAGCGGSRMAKCGVRLFNQAATLRSPRALHYVVNAIDGIDNVTASEGDPGHHR